MDRFNCQRTSATGVGSGGGSGGGATRVACIVYEILDLLEGGSWTSSIARTGATGACSRRGTGGGANGEACNCCRH